MTDEASKTEFRPFWGVLVAVGLALAVLLVFRPLLLTNRVLATGDAFASFHFYRDFANQALAAGRLPPGTCTCSWGRLFWLIRSRRFSIHSTGFSLVCRPPRVWPLRSGCTSGWLVLARRCTFVAPPG